MIRRLWFVSSLALIAAAAAIGAKAATPGGTVLQNTAVATYQLANGTPITTLSNTVTATVAAVPSIALGPAENGCNPATDNVGAGLPVVRTFTLTNTGNVVDAYVVTTSATNGATIQSVALNSGGATTPLANGATTPQIAPGQSVTLIVTAATANVPVGTQVIVTLQAASTAAASAGSGAVVNSASQCAIVAQRAGIAGPGGPGTQVQKLVDGMPFETVQPGQRVKYTINFQNTGGVPALNVTVTDNIPAQLVPDPSTLTLNGTPVTPAMGGINGQVLSVKVASLAPATVQSLSFYATVQSGTTVGASYINTAQISSDNASSVTSTQASVLTGTANIVYDGYAGANSPVSGATIALLPVNSTTPLVLPTIAPGLAGANTNNVDPFVTGANGAYSFVLSPAQLGVGATGATYDVSITAPGYRSRSIRITIVPNADGSLYNVTLQALDGQPLAVAGGFSLTSSNVTLSNVFGLFGNLPLFRTQAVSIVKTVDRETASSGQRLVYTLNFTNNADALGATTVVDDLPPGIVYAPGTARYDGKPLEPAVAGRVLTWTFPSLTAPHTIVFAAVILPGILDNVTLTNVATISAIAPNAPGVPLTATSNAQTFVTPGVFSDRTVITGRVFLDTANTGYFEKSDVGLAGVRIYLEDGESVVTDKYGRYDFPGVKEGMHVLRLDPTTLPPGAALYPDRSYDSQKSPRRLVHGVFDGGVIQDINFAIEAVQ